MAEHSETQQFVDAFYHQHGPCCAGCDWWKYHNSRVGDCTRSAPVDGQARWAMLGFERLTGDTPSGHIVTERDHKCGEFLDTFDWQSLPKPYREKIGVSDG